MIGLPTDTPIWLAAGVTDLRRGFTGLSALVQTALEQEPAPSRPKDRALAGPGLLAHVLVSKYSDHLPLYRQSGIYAHAGVDLDRSTLADWVGGASRALQR